MNYLKEGSYKVVDDSGSMIKMFSTYGAAHHFVLTSPGAYKFHIKKISDIPTNEEVIADTGTPLTGANQDVVSLKDFISQHSHVGSSLAPEESAHKRRMKVKYQTEQSVDYDTEAQSDKAAKATQKAQLILRHAKEKEALADRHHAQKAALTREDTEDLSEDEIESADYKTDKLGRKYKARKIYIEELEVGDESHDELDLQDHELDMMADYVNFDDLLDVTGDEHIAIMDMDTGECINDCPVQEEALMEMLSRAERMRSRIRFLRTAPKRERRLEIVLRKRADAKTLTKRARRMAINLLKRKLMKKSPSQMSIAEKERAEAMIAQRKGLIDRLAIRLVPKIRQLESQRLSGGVTHNVTSQSVT